ncbi:MAG: isochorismatase family protein, partial [Lachnospiraceae bacterium]|nr:isochorismatase family protein [Lachnospiraceae bacterium]
EAVAIVDNVRKKIDEYLGSGGTVIYTRDTHTEAYLQTHEGRNLPVVHCVKGTSGWEISEKVYAEGGPVVDKPSFGSLALPEVVRSCVVKGEDLAAQGEDSKNAQQQTFQNPQNGESLYNQDDNSDDGIVPDSIELVGLCTDICVISNAMILKAAFPEVPIAVDASCCAGVTPESHENALKAMQMCQIQIL